VLAEAALLLAIGGGLGMAMAVVCLPILNRATGGRFPPLFVSGDTWLLATAVAVTLALAVGLPPAMRAKWLEIADALAGR
jgi:putative ABC transport system permease protein